MYQNRLSLIGFSGKEPEQKFTNGGAAYTVLSLATKTSWKNSNDEWESRTEWHRIVAWAKLAEFALTLARGAHLQVEGELRSREYEKDGVKCRIWECKAYRIAKLDRIERADDARFCRLQDIEILPSELQIGTAFVNSEVFEE